MGIPTAHRAATIMGTVALTDAPPDGSETTH
jgi:hypothetical protein